MKSAAITYEEYQIAVDNGFDVPHLLGEGESAIYANGIWTLIDKYGEEYAVRTTTARELGALLLFIEWDE